MRYGKNAVGVVCAVLLSACASNEPPAINGEFVAINAAQPMDTNSYSLTQVSQPQVEAASSTLAPTEPQLANVQSQATNDELFLDSGTASISEVVTPPPLQDYFIYPDETYLSALNRWFKSDDDIRYIAWAIDDDTQTILNRSPTKIERFSGSNIEALNTLSKSLNIPLIFSRDSYHQRAAIHQWPGREVQISMVDGASLSGAIKQIAADYGWNWIDTGQSPSWLAANDYPFLTSYPIVTPKGDIARALKIILSGYPVSAQLLDSTQTLFIVDTK